ncbi:hypothetical protein PORY_002761 [Pneumocystis oryctolagi]|uniref:Uncharacterized protein n=1 Tax=Pneumocystis oryctolagi TaxID=42067 RepID=A0ACB7C9V9_9ASCO|nr:hypothetical protein PORY_002761 [Pneumocystis oryctolagi]
MKLSASQLSYLHSSLLQNPSIRPDARGPTQFRPLFVQVNVLPLTYGSSYVRWGDISVVVGIKAEIIDALNLNISGKSKRGGKITVNVEIFPNSSNENDDNDSVSAFFTESLLQSLSGIRLERLLVTSTKAWSIFIDAVVISSNNYALPALALAARLALQTTKLPHIIAHIAPESIDADKVAQNIGFGEFEVDHDLKNGIPVPDIENVGVIIFVANVGDNILYDISNDEIEVVEGLLAVGVLKNGQITYTRRIHIPNNYKTSTCGLKYSIVKKMLEGAANIGKELIKKSEEDAIYQSKNNQMSNDKTINIFEIKEISENKKKSTVREQDRSNQEEKMMEVLSNKFEILNNIGNGSFGNVVLARKKDSSFPESSLVAIKTMKKTFQTVTDCLKLREIQSLHKLPPHPHIIPIYDSFLDPTTKRLHMVMEHMEGNLYQLIKSRNKKVFDVQTVQNILYQILSALKHIHDNNFFHRDIKPENILVSSVSNQKLVELSTFDNRFQTCSPATWIHKDKNIEIGGGEWKKGLKLAEKLGFSFPKIPPISLETILSNSWPPSFISFIRWTMQWDPLRRPNCMQSLQHPFFNKIDDSSEVFTIKTDIDCASTPLQPSQKKLNVQDNFHNNEVKSQISKVLSVDEKHPCTYSELQKRLSFNLRNLFSKKHQIATNYEKIRLNKNIANDSLSEFKTCSQKPQSKNHCYSSIYKDKATLLEPLKESIILEKTIQTSTQIRKQPLHQESTISIKPLTIDKNKSNLINVETKHSLINSAPLNTKDLITNSLEKNTKYNTGLFSYLQKKVKLSEDLDLKTLPNFKTSNCYFDNFQNDAALQTFNVSNRNLKTHDIKSNKSSQKNTQTVHNSITFSRNSFTNTFQNKTIYSVDQDKLTKKSSPLATKSSKPPDALSFNISCKHKDKPMKNTLCSVCYVTRKTKVDIVKEMEKNKSRCHKYYPYIHDLKNEKTKQQFLTGSKSKLLLKQVSRPFNLSKLYSNFSFMYYKPACLSLQNKYSLRYGNKYKQNTLTETKPLTDQRGKDTLSKFYTNQTNSPIKDLENMSEISQKYSSFLINTQKQKNRKTSQKHDQKLDTLSLRTRTRKVPKSVIDKRWTRIPESSLTQIVDILKDIQRPVIMNIRHKTRRMDAQRNLNIMISKIRDRLSKLLVPPPLKESYNYERLREKNQELESILVSNLEQISRLEKTLDHEKSLLAKEESDFRELAKNAQYDENSRKQQFKKFHPLLRQEEDILESEFSYTQINLDENNTFSSYDVSNDRAFISLEKQLKRYVNSVKSDSKEVEKIIQLSQKAQTSLLKVLTLYDYFISHKILTETCV